MNIKEAFEIIKNELPLTSGAVEEALNLVETAVDKQIPKQPCKSEGGQFYICPNCNKLVRRNEQSHGWRNIPFCKWCGQAWLWESDTNE